jgi:hypothetical protein
VRKPPKLLALTLPRLPGTLDTESPNSIISILNKVSKNVNVTFGQWQTSKRSKLSFNELLIEKRQRLIDIPCEQGGPIRMIFSDISKSNNCGILGLT